MDYVDNSGVCKILKKYLKSSKHQIDGINIVFDDVNQSESIENFYSFIIQVSADDNKSFIGKMVLEKIELIISNMFGHFFGFENNITYEWDITYNNRISLSSKTVIIGKKDWSDIVFKLNSILKEDQPKKIYFEILNLSVKFVINFTTYDGDQIHFPAIGQENKNEVVFYCRIKTNLEDSELRYYEDLYINLMNHYMQEIGLTERLLLFEPPNEIYPAPIVWEIELT